MRKGPTRAMIRWGIAAKLLGGFGIVLLLALIVGAADIKSLAAVDALRTTLYDDQLVPIRDLARARADLADMDSQVQRSLSDPAGKGMATYRSAVDKDVADIDRLIGGLDAMAPSGDAKQGLAALHPDWKQYQDALRGVLQAAGSGDVPGATKLYVDQAAPLYANVSGELAALIDAGDRAAQAVDAQLDDTYARGRALTIGLLALAAATAGAVALWLARSVAGAARQVADASRQLARGDLDQRVAVRSRDELGEMAAAFADLIAHQKAMAATADAIAGGDLGREVRPQSERDALGLAFQRMAQNLRAMLAGVQAGSRDLASAGAQILAAASQQAAGASQQSAAISQTTATVEQVRAPADHAVQAAAVVSQAAQQANRVALEGVQAVQDAQAGMQETRDGVQQIAQQIAALSERTQQIG